jgi:hypothetical protein
MLFCPAFTAAQEPPPAEYVQAMQSILAAVQAFGEFSEADAESQDFEAAAAAATSAKTAFEYIREFWSDPSTDAGQLAEAGWAAALSAEVAADFVSAEGVTFAAGEMGETCMPCHSAHRDQLEDGSFVIK